MIRIRYSGDQRHDWLDVGNGEHQGFLRGLGDPNGTGVAPYAKPVGVPC